MHFKLRAELNRFQTQTCLKEGTFKLKRFS